MCDDDDMWGRTASGSEGGTFVEVPQRSTSSQDRNDVCYLDPAKRWNATGERKVSHPVFCVAHGIVKSRPRQRLPASCVECFLLARRVVSDDPLTLSWRQVIMSGSLWKECNSWKAALGNT